jgi:hypothetical protein
MTIAPSYAGAGAHFEAEEDYLQRQNRELKALSSDVSALEKRLNSLTQFRKKSQSFLGSVASPADRAWSESA